MRTYSFQQKKQWLTTKTQTSTPCNQHSQPRPPNCFFSNPCFKWRGEAQYGNRAPRRFCYSFYLWSRKTINFKLLRADDTVWHGSWPLARPAAVKFEISAKHPFCCRQCSLVTRGMGQNSDWSAKNIRETYQLILLQILHPVNPVMTCGWIHVRYCALLINSSWIWIEHYQNCTSGTGISLYVVTCTKGSCCKVSGKNMKKHQDQSMLESQLRTLICFQWLSTVGAIIKIIDIGKLMAIPCPFMCCPWSKPPLV